MGFGYDGTRLSHEEMALAVRRVSSLVLPVVSAEEVVLFVSQPFCLSRQLGLLAIDGKMLIGTCGESSVHEKILWRDSPEDYFSSVACNEDANELVVCVYGSGSVDLFRQGEEGRWEKSGSCAVDFEPSTCVMHGGRYVVSATTMDFEDSFYVFDPESCRLSRVPESMEDNFPVTAGFPVLVSTKYGLMVYCGVLSEAYWLDEVWRVNSTIVLPEGAVVGPSSCGDVVYGHKSEGQWIFLTLSRGGSKQVVREVGGGQISQLEGVCLSGQDLWISDLGGAIRMVK